MAAYSPACHAPARTGLVDIKIAFPFTGTLVQLGHATDMIQYHKQPFYHDVPGDRNGGHQGPPIESQFLGEIIDISFSLSSFAAAGITLLEKRGLLTTVGTIPQDVIGDFVMTTTSMRLLLHTEATGDTRNFWCAIPRQPYQVAVGTKFSEWIFGFQCHRPPCGHAKANIIEDANSDAYA